MFKKLEKILLTQWAFVPLFALASASVIGATAMFIKYNIGATNEIFVTELLKQGLASGNYQGASSFATGFLLARLLEGPLVGILDIGGALLTGVGIGIPAVILETSWKFLIENFYFALLTGLFIGAAIGLFSLVLKKIMPKNFPVGATAVLMGAGNKTGEALGPLVLIYALAYSLPAGIGSIIGALLFYKIDKPIVGGVILGAMIMSLLFMLLGLPIHPATATS